MTHSFKLSRRIARLRAPVFAAIILALTGCDNVESLNPVPSTDPEVADESPLTDDESSVTDEVAPLADDASAVEPVDAASAAASFAGGIPIGTGRQPNSEFGSRYNGALRQIYPQFLRSNLASIKARGGKVVLMLAGNEGYYKDASGHFSMSKWKARVDRFRGVNFSSYIKDGTIIAHYLIDEPYDPVNWNGRPVPGATLEEMAKYSKQIWPDMVTVVRAEPGQMKWSGTYRYLDAAWASFFNPRGILNVNDYIRRNVADAQRMGLGLVVGLNLIKGAPPWQGPGRGGSKMSAAQVESWGSALLSSSYPCAFISYTYDAGYLASGSIKSAMDALRRKAQNRAPKSCRG